jgi:signal transduction histidine kinase
VARMTPEPPALTLAPVDLNTLVLLYVADRTLMAEERGLSLTFTGEPDLPKAQADQAQVERVLGILLVNALNYTPRGGRVEVSTHSRQEEGRVQAGFSVSDTGPGIAPDEQARLFEQFFRGRAALEGGVPGTGLGLSVAKEIVEQHGGEVEVVSEGVPGEGTTVTVWLPMEGEAGGKGTTNMAKRRASKISRRDESAMQPRTTRQKPEPTPGS